MTSFLAVVIEKLFSVSFVCSAVIQGIPLLYGATGEIITEKSGNLNLGIPGIMYMGAVGGLTGSFIYENYSDSFNPVAGIFVAFLGTVLFSLIGGIIYSVLTITFRANQNVTGLALTTFGIGVGNFLGGSLSRIAGTASQITVYKTGQAFKTSLPYLENIPVVGKLFFSYGILTYLSIVIAIISAYILKKTKTGINLQSVGENAAAADAAGIPIAKYKYTATLIGSVISGIGGLYFVMEYLGGTWQNNGFGDRGWLAIALVIFALWRPVRVIWGAILFGGLYILYSYIPIGGAVQEIFKMLPYAVTIIVLIVTSVKKRKENQPPMGLGLSYFREER